MDFSEEQATGIERLELLGDLLGVDVFDNKAPEMTRMGTLESPIPIFTLVSVILSGYKAYTNVLCLSCAFLPPLSCTNSQHIIHQPSNTHHSPTFPCPTKPLYVLACSTLNELSAALASRPIRTTPTGSDVRSRGSTTDATSAAVVS